MTTQYPRFQILQSYIFGVENLSSLMVLEIADDLEKTWNEIQKSLDGEHWDDISSSSIQYLLLPAYLSIGYSRIQDNDRKEFLNMSNKWIEEFFWLMDRFNLVVENCPSITSVRDRKIEQYRQRKKLEQNIGWLVDETLGKADEEQYRLVVKQYLDHFQMELSELKIANILEMRVLDGGAVETSENKVPETKPFVLIPSRLDAVETVFRHGHNLPTMTVDEYLERRVQAPDQAGGHEKEVDLKSIRKWDEFRDEHRRGSGNTFNQS